jgi:hypothetical protein
MQDDATRAAARQKRLGHTVLLAIFVEVRNEVLVLALKLHAQGDDNIESVEPL